MSSAARIPTAQMSTCRTAEATHECCIVLQPGHAAAWRYNAATSGELHACKKLAEHAVFCKSRVVQLAAHTVCTVGDCGFVLVFLWLPFVRAHKHLVSEAQGRSIQPAQLTPLMNCVLQNKHILDTFSTQQTYLVAHHAGIFAVCCVQLLLLPPVQLRQKPPAMQVPVGIVPAIQTSLHHVAFPSCLTSGPM